ncbi:hypothetical protein [Novosphingobium sp. PY1]|uniref:Uncharacterized protein n=1 Tax=Ochrobactrum sp. PW1 TaxID=1882222 RepID=A0A292GSG7_9HYPH|nr:hypothetical protein [Novosphingobium sp. PY1]BBA74436.1 hypothetical protein [Ochrobactrum sp. PW1]GFM29285.1 uncharacterized protein PY1_contig-07-211 [Novosphingobium sp. PY1]
MNLREKVAQAICDAAPARLEAEFLPIDAPFLADAAIRTVLEALKEPTPLAVLCGERACDFDLYSPEVRAVWQAMLDQAIREHAMDELIAGDADLIAGRDG